MRQSYMIDQRKRIFAVTAGLLDLALTTASFFLAYRFRLVVRTMRSMFVLTHDYAGSSLSVAPCDHPANLGDPAAPVQSLFGTIPTVSTRFYGCPRR